MNVMMPQIMQQLVQQLIRAGNTENIKGPFNWPSVWDSTGNRQIASTE